MACGVEVSWIQLEVPDNLFCIPSAPLDPNNGGCGCGGGAKDAQCSTFNTVYGDGSVSLEANDVMASGFAQPWGHSRSFFSQSACSVGNGYGWQVAQWSRLAVLSGGDTIVVMGRSHQALWFDRVGSLGPGQAAVDLADQTAVAAFHPRQLGDDPGQLAPHRQVAEPAGFAARRGLLLEQPRSRRELGNRRPPSSSFMNTSVRAPRCPVGP